VRYRARPSKGAHGERDANPASREAPPDAWRVVSTFRPGERGTRHLLRDWGHRLVCVRYRYNARLNRRIKTAEIIMDEGPWRRKDSAEVGIAIRSWENELRLAIVAAGGKWDRELAQWVLTKGAAARLGLQDRVEKVRRHDPLEANITGNAKANARGNPPRPANTPGNRQ
jgi:hypothetical protein